MVDTILTFINGIVLKGNAKSLDVPFWSFFFLEENCPV